MAVGPAPGREYREPVVAWPSPGRLRAGLVLVAVAAFYGVSWHLAKVNLTKLADGLLWHRLRGRSVSESGRLCHGEGGHEGATAAGGC